ncbi:MAG: replication-relaxation family protein [Planctomycetes bacterium]|nr:replication-relaxation family protein [Planctomycetota bacterium]
MTSTFTTSRDVELLTSLVMGPLTTAQLLKLSETFAAGPFRSARTLLDRLQRLARAGFVKRFPLAILPAHGGGLPHYYKLTLAGLRMLYGEDARPPTKHLFAPVAVSRHHHTHALSEFLVTTAVAAKRHGFRISDIYPENTLVLDVNGETLIPDARFDLRRADGRFRFLIELDCSTETIRSTKHDDTIHRKLRLHDAYRDQNTQRHRVVFVCSRSRDRLTNILDAAASIVRNPERTLFLGVYLPDFVNASNPVGEKIFSDHRGQRKSLLPTI